MRPSLLTSRHADTAGNYQVNLVATFILLAVPYVPAAFATFIVREREVRQGQATGPPSGLSLTPPHPQVKAKHQQLVSGVSIPAYWLAAFLWDNLTYQVTVWCIVILVSAFPNTESLSGSSTIGHTIALLVLYGSAISGFTYCISFFFATPSGAQVRTPRTAHPPRLFLFFRAPTSTFFCFAGGWRLCAQHPTQPHPCPHLKPNPNRPPPPADHRHLHRDCRKSPHLCRPNG